MTGGDPVVSFLPSDRRLPGRVIPAHGQDIDRATADVLESLPDPEPDPTGHNAKLVPDSVTTLDATPDPLRPPPRSSTDHLDRYGSPGHLPRRPEGSSPHP